MELAKQSRSNDFANPTDELREQYSKEKKTIPFLRSVHEELNTAMKIDDEIFDILIHGYRTERKVDSLEEFL